MLPNSKAPPREMTLGDDAVTDRKVLASPSDYRSPLVGEVFDFKADRIQMKVKTRVLDYFKKYPTFAKGLFTNDHIQKICLVVEKHAFTKKVDKRALVLDVMSVIAQRQLDKDEIASVCNAVEFLHRSKLIEVALYRKVLNYFVSFFR